MRTLALACLLIVIMPQDLDAGILKFVANQNSTRGILSFLFGRPRICNCLCGRPNRVQSRIQSGEFTQTHEFPWLVAVVINGSRVASGALINDRYVITANTPLNGLTPYDVKVTIGAFDRCFSDLSSVNDSISSIIPLPNYDQRAGTHDVALLKLTNPVTFNRNIHPICLPDPNARYLGQVVTVVSWGPENNTASGNVTTPPANPANATNPAGRRRRAADLVDEYMNSWNDYGEEGSYRIKRQTQQSTIACLPKKLGLPVLGEGRCPDAEINTQQVLDDTGCAGISGAPNQVCRNDTGAPVQFRDHRGVYQLVGVISINNECSNNTMPTLYTRINRYIGWIYSNTQDACYCSQSLKFGF